jgi:two-component system nitrate/nitrite response regulator NarL
MDTVRLVVADDHPLVLRGITDCLSASPQLQILASCPDGSAALEAIQALDPDIALLDVAMPGLTGLQVLDALKRSRHRTRVVLLSAHLDRRVILAAIADGASAFLLKECSPDELQRCILAVASGQTHFPLELAFDHNTTVDATVKRDGLAAMLTEREWQVMKSAAEGLSNKSIARALDITEGTVKVHLHQIFKKLGVSNRTTLANLIFQYKP